MNILLTAATEMELNNIKVHNDEFEINDHQIHYLVSDVGMQASTFHLTKAILNQSYDLILQVGIAGAYTTAIDIGQVVEVIKETYGDLGAEDKEDQLYIFDMNIMQQDAQIFNPTHIENPQHYTHLFKANSISVNNCAGNSTTIEKRKTYFQPDIETMEGISVHYVGAQLQIPYLHLRAISNYVLPRDKSTWNIPLALSNLTTFVVDFLKQLK